MIQILDQTTINQIAAGEVIDRPASVVKELVENAVDAGATAVSVEIKDGGISLIRVTDNGCGIPGDEIPVAFLRHATSKIHSVEDLLSVRSLGFRGEALSSIAAVSQVELITKTADRLDGYRYRIEGGKEIGLEPVGAPDGTTFLMRNLFYNTPARRKFLKSPQTEGSYIADLMERLALSRPDVSFRFLQQGQEKLHSSGNHNVRDLIYQIYGRDAAASLLPVSGETSWLKLEGFIGKPVLSRGNRSFENYFINGRYIRSSLIGRAIEEAYKPYLMQHRYPFTVLHLTVAPELLDVNVHPSKMELRFRNQEEIYEWLKETLRRALETRELIPEVSVPEAVPTAPKKPSAPPGMPEKPADPKPEPAKKPEPARSPEPFERVREAQQLRETGTYEARSPLPKAEAPEQMSLFEEKVFTSQNRKAFRLIGQLFETYWLVEYQDTFLLIDQHAAHEKVLYEKTMAALKTKEHTCQSVNPPLILTLNPREELALKEHGSLFAAIGFEIEPFGGREYAVYGVPGNLFSLAKKELLMEMLENLAEEEQVASDLILEKIASLSCKAAVKGNQRLSHAEAEALIDQLLGLENPYNCPHGRPTMISMSRYELEKKFKRIV